MNLIFSRRLAIAIGVVLPLAETFRALLSRGPISLQLDHYLMGAFLLYGAWRCRKYDIIGQRYIIAAWAFTSGIGYMILQRYVEGTINLGPSLISHIWPAVFIGFGWLFSILGLAASFTSQHNADSDTRDSRNS
jgi:hypothetical protein